MFMTIFRIHSLPYGEIDGYYTYNQIIDAIGYYTDGKPVSPLLNDPDPDFLEHLKRISKRMENYKMDIILAREILLYDNMCDTMVSTFGIHPTKFISRKNVQTERKITAPNYREAEYCGNCIHFHDQTMYDDTMWGECDIHTELNEVYDPPLKNPLYLGCHEVCDDFCLDKDEV